MKPYRNLFSPGYIGSLQVKNRIVMPPMATCFGSATGEVTESMIAYYTERARGGVGLIVIENAQVDYPNGKKIATQIACDGEQFIPGLNELAESCQQYGAKVFVQIHHAGREAINPVGPSEIPSPLIGVKPKKLSAEGIEIIIQKFVQAALYIKKAGFDGVELHAAHGYLLNQFLSPLSNNRHDKYGGKSMAKRAYIIERIIKGVKFLCGQHFPVSVRFSADEFVAGGNQLEQGKELAVILQKAGADILNVSCGTSDSRTKMIEPYSYKEGWRAYLAREIKKTVEIPVITVGQIRNPLTADDIIAKGWADFVALGRQLICDPHYPKKVEIGREEDIIPCLSCNTGCIGRTAQGHRLRCALNPTTGREKEYTSLIPALHKKKVMVIGGGPGGMEAARVAALRGHTVTLYEKTSELGGQINLAKIPPLKGRMEGVRQWFIRQIQQAGVNIKLDTELNLSYIKNLNPDVIILATGGKPSVPAIPGIENTAPVTDLMSGRTRAGKSVTIIGGGMLACEAALYLSELGIKDISLIEQLSCLASDIEPITRTDLLERIEKAKIKAHTGARIIKITKNSVFFESGGERKVLSADTVLFATGTEPDNDLAGQVAGLGKDHFLVGDCCERNHNKTLMNAIHTGSMIGRQV